jgi:hypothetical protein
MAKVTRGNRTHNLAQYRTRSIRWPKRREIEIRGPNATVHNPLDGQWNPVNESIQRGVAGARSAPRAISTRARRAETQKNEQSTHADGGSMGPSALDQEIGTTRSCVLGRQISRGLRSMPRQWQ